ncbi:MAG: N-acetylmuramoyl-L-alanine amidase [Bacteroidia bacterium]
MQKSINNSFTSLLLGALMLMTFLKSNAQHIRTQNFQIRDSIYQHYKNGFTSLAIQCDDLSSLAVIADGIEYSLERNVHFSDLNLSNLLIFNKAQTALSILYLGESQAELTLQLYNDSYTDISTSQIEPAISRKRSDCDLPPLIDQDVWRDGLPEPKPNPSTTQVSHLVVHHSATSNNVTDYTLAVRNIYLYHKNNNGWDDVGYNYLIAPDGTLYAGRDGQGKEDDNIRGAHFCAKNSYTMGVCLIGNYSETEPSDSMLKTLEELLAWKAKKEEIQPLEQDFHPKGSSSGFELATICGHRDGYKAGVFDGCQTECPGSLFYKKLDTVRIKVAKRLVDCGFAVGNDEIIENKGYTFLNGKLFIPNSEASDYQVVDINGKIILKGVATQNHIDLKTLPSGLFVITISTNQSTHTLKIINNGNK